jgi:hypothetical protein
MNMRYGSGNGVISSKVGLARFVLFAWIVGCHSHDKLPAISDTTSPAACPTHLDFELNGGSSRFDPGYTGVAHGVGLADHTRFSVKITDRDPECRRVKFQGPVAPDPARNPINSQRCLNAIATTCTADSDCPNAKAGSCVTILPPISTSLGIPTCAIGYLEPVAGPDPTPVEGVFDLATGELDMARFNIYVDIYLGACPTCLDDHTELDGIKDGHCSSASAAACDIVGNNTQQVANTSYDCPPSGTPLTTITLPGTDSSTSDHAWTMNNSRPACSATAAAGKKCWCGMCSGSNATACSSSDDCTSGTCGGTNGGSGSAAVVYNTANNTCVSPGTCTWDAATQHGTCSNDATKKCFPDTGTIIAHGSAEVRGDGVYNSQIANLTCLPTTGGGAGALIDASGGFPGPLLFQAKFTVQPRVSP